MDFEFLATATANRPKVFDDYDFNESVRIGRGSYGQVYKAREKNSSNDQFFALKEVEMTSYSPSTCREIALYRETKHPNISNLLKVYFSYSTSKAWLLFDYAEYDLHSMIKFYRTGDTNQNQMPDTLKKSCLFQILNGIKYLHDNWILHRDLKPENILVMGDGTERGCIKITDMGMARTFHSPLKPLGDVDVVVVTSWYRAPELLLGARHYTKAIDIFSIGCIFAELLTYVPIFSCTPEQAPQPMRTPYQHNQLDKIFSVLGYPTLAAWSELRYIPEYATMQKEFIRSKYTGCTLAKYMKSFGIGPKALEFQLLSKLLTMDPKKRSSSFDALCHPYFHQKPQPTADVFNCFESEIPFPHRKYLAKVEPTKAEIKAKIMRKTHLLELNYQCQNQI